MYRFYAAVLIFLCLVKPCSAELRSDEIAIIAARGDAKSVGLARYYASARKVPEKNICVIDVPANESLPRDAWRQKVRPAIHRWLSENDPQQRIRCLVTVWGIPLKIGPVAADRQLQKYQQFLIAERAHRLKLLNQILAAFDQIAPGSGEPGVLSEEVLAGEDVAASPTKDADQSPPDIASGGRRQPSPELTRLQRRLEAALQRAQRHLAEIPQGEQRRRGEVQVQQLATATGGLHVLLPALNQKLTTGSEPNPAARAEFDALRGRVTGLTESRALLEQMPANIERDALILALLERLGGLIGSVQWLDQQLFIVKQNPTGASFDSELSLVMWDDYELLRWQPNYLRPNFHNSQLPKFNRTLMVSRIDAPTIDLARGLVDAAVEVEKQGLRGKVYFDTRGVANLDNAVHDPGSPGDYDRSLLNIAKAIGDQTELEVVQETTPQLFQPGQCPDAALYCGWYSLAKYVDAFEWNRGAVAYHLASSEAATLRDPRSQVWCKKLLEDGVCATIGPVYEPYLAAFPRPDEFFALLLRGDLTLVECYYQTQPFNSWMMTLIGDPLYQPFKYRAIAAAPPAEVPQPPTAQPTEPPVSAPTN